MPPQYKLHELKLRDDYQGKTKAVLVISRAEKQSNKAILYIHGFVDYFFQDELAAWANGQGYHFYALDLRRHGRSLLPHQSPNHFRSHEEFDEEIGLSVEYIRHHDNNHTLVLLGHSTGGLISVLYANKHPEAADAIMLNSPFFDFNESPLVKNMMPVLAFLGKLFPESPSMARLAEGAGMSLHKNFHGEWDYDLALKPIHGFPITLGWIGAVHRAQNKVKAGLDIQVPVLLMHSAKSVKPGKYHPSMQSADSVLNITDMKRLAHQLGNDVTLAEIKNGIHDLVLSAPEVRKEVCRVMAEFLKKQAKSSS